VNRTTELSEYASAASFDALPIKAVDAAKSVTMDLLGVAAGASRNPVAEVMVAYVGRTASADRDRGATIFGAGLSTSPAEAALANGTLAADLELDDVHPTANLHAGSVFVPALFAIGESRGRSGRDWITALAVAYDVGCRVSLALGDVGQTDRGYHPTALSGVFGAAAGAARMLGLDSRQVAETLGLAGAQASGLLTWRTEAAHYTKSFQSGMAARSAVTAAELVEAGYRGPEQSLDGRYNIFQVFTDVGNPELLTAGLGSRFEIEGTGYKFYNCCRAIHAPLEIVYRLMAENGLSESDIAGVDVWLPRDMVPVVDHNELITHDLQYVIAVGIRDGDVGQAQMSEQRRGDPSLVPLIERVTLAPDDELNELHPPHWPARARITLLDGRTFEARLSDPRGNPDDPPTWDELAEKFRRVVSGILSDPDTSRALDVIADLEGLDDLRVLGRLFTGVARTNDGR
jgi:2-methylcitrate dehydratase PrpD